MHKVSSRDCLSTAGVWCHFLLYCITEFPEQIVHTSICFRALHWSFMRLSSPGRFPLRFSADGHEGQEDADRDTRPIVNQAFPTSTSPLDDFPNSGAFPTCWGALVSLLSIPRACLSSASGWCTKAKQLVTSSLVGSLIASSVWSCVCV